MRRKVVEIPTEVYRKPSRKSRPAAVSSQRVSSERPMKGQIQFNLLLKEDRNGDEFMIGSTDVPASVDLQNATFVVFFPDDGETTGTMVIRNRNVPPRRSLDRGNED